MNTLPGTLQLEGIIRGAGFIIFRKIAPDDIIEYLLLKSSGDKQYWCPPKGHVEPGEEIYQAALRETKEETGFDRDVFRVIPDFNCEVKYNVKSGKDDRKKTKVIKLWLAEQIDQHSKVNLSSDHQEYKWLPLKEAIDLIGNRRGYKDFKECFEQCEKKIQSL